MITASGSTGVRIATPVLGILALGLLLGAAQAPPVDLQSGLIAHWKLDETSGSSAADSAGSNTGTHTGGPAITTSGLATAIKFPDAACLTFDGVDDYVTAGTNPALDPATMTVAFWTKNLVAPAQWDGLTGKSHTHQRTQGRGF